MKPTAIDRLPPGDETTEGASSSPTGDPLAPPPIVVAIDPTLARMWTKAELSRLLGTRTSLAEIEGWFFSLGGDVEDEQRGHFIRRLLDYAVHRGRLPELLETIKRDRPDLIE